MNLYKVRYGQDEGVFEYEHFLNSDLFEGDKFQNWQIHYG